MLVSALMAMNAWSRLEIEFYKTAF